MKPWTRQTLDLGRTVVAPPGSTHQEESDWRNKILAELLHGAGLVRVQLNVGSDLAEAKAEVERLCALFGVFIPQSIRRERIFSVTNEGGRRGAIDNRGARSGGALDWHTDSAPNWQGVTPDIVGLYGHVTRASGGDTLVACARTVLDYMKRGFPDLVDQLYEPLAFDQRTEAHPGQDTVLRSPVLREHRGRTTVRFAPVYIFRGHELVREPLTARQALAVLSFCSCAYHPDNHIPLHLAPGELLLINNRELIHARTAYDDADDSMPRHLLRIWMVADDPEFPRP